MQKDTKKMLYCSVYSINNNIYFYHEPVELSQKLSTCFIEHHHCISLLFSWLLFFPPFSSLLQLLNFFLRLFYSYSLDPTLFQSF